MHRILLLAIPMFLCHKITLCRATIITGMIVAAPTFSWGGDDPAAGGGLSSAEPASAQPNIVLYVSDGHGYRDSTLYDPASPIHTPNLLRIAAAGATYTHAFAATPDSASSQSVLHSGSSAHYRQMPLGHAPTGDTAADESASQRTLAEHLNSMGYRLVSIGTPPNIEGQEIPFEVIGTGIRTDVPTGEGAGPQGAVDLAAWLRAASSNDHRPIFLLIHDAGLDADCRVAAQNAAPLGKFMRRGNAARSACESLSAAQAEYARRVVALDRRVGQAYDSVAQVLPPSETLFIYTSGYGADLPYGKWNLYDAGVRVPLVVVWKNHVPQGSRMDAMLSSVDFLPTLVDIAGGIAPSEIEGRSFAGVLRSEGYDHRDLVFASVGKDGSDGIYPSCSVRDRRFKYIRNLAAESEFSTPRRRFVDLFDARSAYRRRPAEELYDLLSDPTEQRNLAADPAYAENLAEFRSQMSLWFTRHSAPVASR